MRCNPAIRAAAWLGIALAMTRAMKHYTCQIALAVVAVTCIFLGACKEPRGNDAPHRAGHGTTHQSQMTKSLH